MSSNNQVLVRNAREQDIPAVAEIEEEAFSPQGTAETPQTFQMRLTAFPNGFIILVAENEVAAYGCSEKRLTEGEPGFGPNLLSMHQPDGKIFFITGLAVRTKYRGRGYRLLILDKLIETAHLEGCRKILVETTQAQDLYRKRGFVTVRSRTEAGVSWEVMSLDLKPTSMTS